MKTRQLKILEETLGYGIRILISGLNLRLASYTSSDKLTTQNILTLIDKIDNELKDTPELLFENSKAISDVYYKGVGKGASAEPEQLLSTSHSILEDSFVLTLRYALICEALQVIPADYPIKQKQELENSLKVIEMESKRIQAILDKTHGVLANSVYSSIVVLTAAECGISIEEADSQQR